MCVEAASRFQEASPWGCSPASGILGAYVDSQKAGVQLAKKSIWLRTILRHIIFSSLSSLSSVVFSPPWPP